MTMNPIARNAVKILHYHLHFAFFDKNFVEDIYPIFQFHFGLPMLDGNVNQLS